MQGAGDPYGTPDQQVGAIAEHITAWARGQRPYYPLMGDAAIFADLDFVADEATTRRAKELLVEQGILGVDEDGFFYVA